MPTSALFSNCGGVAARRVVMVLQVRSFRAMAAPSMTEVPLVSTSSRTRSGLLSEVRLATQVCSSTVV